MKAVLVCAAWEPELTHFRSLVPPSSGLGFVGVGIGLVDAAAGTARALGEHRPGAAVLVGTCGAFEGRGLTVGDVVVADRVGWIDAARVSAQAALPPSVVVALEAEPGWRARAERAGARRVQIATTSSVTTDDGLARQLAAHGDVEHLEAFAFARACATSAPPVPWAVVLGVANMVGASGREQWRAHHLEASRRAAEVARAMITAK